jgi:hypothetical protein
MKLLVIALLLVGGFLLYRMTIGNVQDSYQFCVDQALTGKADTATLSCGAQRTVYEELISCVTSVQKKSFVGTMLYKPFGTKDKVETLIYEHNDECRESTVEMPGEALYVSY